jgi:hypothetical protein
LSGWKDWQIGEVVEAAEFQTFLQDQVVQVYADSSARGSALGTAVAEGMASYVKDTDSFEVYDGTGWVPVSVDAAWVTAGTAGQILISNGTADPSWVAAETTLAAGSAGELVVSAGTAGVVYEAAEATLTAGTSGFTALSAGTAGISYQPVSHNYIINGAFDVWQRGTSVTNVNFTPENLGSYTADRFKAAGVEEGVAWRSVTLSRSTNSTIGLPYSAKFTINNAAISRTEFRQEVEAGPELSGQQVTMSFFIRRIATVNANTSFLVYHGASQLGAGIAFNDLSTTEFTRVSRTFTASNTTTFGVRLTRTAGPLLNSTGDFFEITGLQLEAGSVATPFKRHAPDVGLEELACKRFYYRITAPVADRIMANGFANTTTQARGSIQFPVRMRIAPSAIEQSGTATDYEIQRQGPSIVGCSAVPAFITATEDAAQFSFTVASGLTAGEGLQLRSDAAGAFLGWSSEL